MKVTSEAVKRVVRSIRLSASGLTKAYRYDATCNRCIQQYLDGHVGWTSMIETMVYALLEEKKTLMGLAIS